MKHLVRFSFEGDDYNINVIYEASKDMSNEIEDAVDSYIESNILDDWEYEDLVKDVMNSFPEIKNWEEIPMHKIKI